jgi:hypothetical protein
MHQNTVSNDCSQCHESDSWLVKNINYIHRMGRFPLEGKHKRADCLDCHSSANNLVFEPIGIECADCHIADYQTAEQPDHLSAGFGTECQDCHQLADTDWKMANVMHDFFPLAGGHQISNCFDCHSQATYEGLDTECLSCHENDYNSSQNPNHINAGFSTDCLECHSTNPGWQPASFKQHDNFFMLLGAHKEIENDCSRCHSNGFDNTPDQCIGCHESDYENTTDPVHKAAGFGPNCESCHNENAWEPSTFDHDNQFFPIYTGEHRGEWNACADCHTNSNNYQIFECITCHEHNQNEMNSEHSGVNGYAYESNACFACHPSGSGEGGFNHSSTGFIIDGAHTGSECSDCHTSGYQEISSECRTCHADDFQNSANPNHLELGLNQICEECHNTSPDWQPAGFPVHNEYYLLEGAHLSIANECYSCHSGNYLATGKLCFDCHSSDYNGTSDPNHQNAGFSTDCESCHSPIAWEPAAFDHDNQFFPIYSGSHNNQWTDCMECHTSSSNYQVFNCVNCHEHNQNETDSEHQGVQGYIYLSQECYSCHPAGDSEGAFDHAFSDFPLTGAHISQDCSSCHINGYQNTAAECVSCHQNSFNNAAEPNHIDAGIQTVCEDCHNSTAWKPSSFDHSATGFGLVGGHILTQCSDCHTVNTANVIPDCYSCHENDYTAAPEHSSLSYPKQCEECHSVNNWKETDFNHSETLFPLTGAHIEVMCGDCHIAGFAGTAMICSDCHQTDYDNSSNPSHLNLSLSNNCEECHSTNADWQPASFEIHNSFYLLQGAHSTISTECNSCHNNDYNNTPNECFECHQEEYNATANPVHSTSGFGTACEDCHNENAWQPSTFDHDNQYFPIYSGEHRNEWNSCADCHINQSNFSQFSCIDCHEHNQNDMDDKHREINDYIYASNACYDCHPDGREGIMHGMPLRKIKSIK